MDNSKSLRLVPGIRDIDAWAELWTVLDHPSPRIVCRTCRNYQLLHDSGKEFVHEGGCRGINAYNRLPWRDLLWIVTQATHEG